MNQLSETFFTARVSVKSQYCRAPVSRTTKVVEHDEAPYYSAWLEYFISGDICECHKKIRV